MSADETLKDVIVKSRESLSLAQEIADKTARPHNVCESHDSMFGLLRAVAQGVDTSLLIQAGRIVDTQAQPNGMGRQPTGAGMSAFWSIVREKASLLILCATAIIIAAIACGQLRELTDAYKAVSPTASTGFGTYQEEPYP